MIAQKHLAVAFLIQCQMKNELELVRTGTYPFSLKKKKKTSLFFSSKQWGCLLKNSGK